MRRQLGPWDRALLALLACWVAFPLLLGRSFAQDAVPFLAAGELARTAPDEVYARGESDASAPSDALRAASCALLPDGEACDERIVSFVSPPLAVGPAVLLAELGAGGGVLALRFVASLATAGSLLALWWRSGGGRRRAQVLAASAALLTPFAMLPVAFGQTSPLLALSVALGTASLARRRSVVHGATLALVVATKLFPLAVVPVAALQRRWALVGTTLAAVVALAAVAALGFADVTWAAFLDASSAKDAAATTVDTNGAPGALVAALLVDGGAQRPLATALGAGAVAVLLVAARRRVPGEALDRWWAVSWLAVLLLVPVVWSHYLWVVPVALGVVALDRTDDAALWLLPLGAAATLPLVFGAEGSTWLQWWKAGVLVGGAALTVWAASAPVAAAPVDVPGAAPQP